MLDCQNKIKIRYFVMKTLRKQILFQKEIDSDVLTVDIKIGKILLQELLKKCPRNNFFYEFFLTQ